MATHCSAIRMATRPSIYKLRLLVHLSIYQFIHLYMYLSIQAHIQRERRPIAQLPEGRQPEHRARVVHPHPPHGPRQRG